MNSTKRKIYLRSIQSHDRFMAQVFDRKADRPSRWMVEGWHRLVEKVFSSKPDALRGRQRL